MGPTVSNLRMTSIVAWHLWLVSMSSLVLSLSLSMAYELFVRPRNVFHSIDFLLEYSPLVRSKASDMAHTCRVIRKVYMKTDSVVA